MNLLIHPTYFPTIAHFAAIAQAKTICFEKADSFLKQTYRNRMFIYGANGKLLLNIPVKHLKTGEKLQYKNTQIESVENWQKQHWKSIESAYRTSPFFEYYEDDIKPLFFTPQNDLYQLNMNIFNCICNCIELNIETITYTSEFHKTHENLTDLRALVNAKKQMNTPLEHYTQVFSEKHGYIANLSVLDLLFNEGPNTLNYLESQSPFW